jgi:hypothetical protein
MQAFQPLQAVQAGCVGGARHVPSAGERGAAHEKDSFFAGAGRAINGKCREARGYAAGV